MKVNIDISDMLYVEVWCDFKGMDWKEEINVCDFIQYNYMFYEGDEFFFVDVMLVIMVLWEKVMVGICIENVIYVLVDFDINIVMMIIVYDVGYIEKDLEKIVGL